MRRDCQVNSVGAINLASGPLYEHSALDFARNDSKINCVSEFQFGGEFVWWPSSELIAKSNLQQFIEKHRLGSYDELMRRSTTDIAWFWNSVLWDLDIQFYKPYSRVVDLRDGKAWAKWCVDGEMNIVHNMLDKYAGTPTDRKPANSIIR